MATKRSLDGFAPLVNLGGRPPALKPEQIAVLYDIVTDCTTHRLCLAATADGISTSAGGLQSVFTLGYRSCVREM
jgi:hypothetical protein